MKPSKSAILSLLLSATLNQGHAAAVPIDTLDLLRVTGVLPQIAILKDLVIDSSLANASRCDTMPPTAPLPSFSADSITHDTLQNFDLLNASEMELITEWFQSRLAQKIHEAEQSDLDSHGVSQYIQVLRENPSRFQTVKRIVKNTRTTAFMGIIGSEVEYAGMLHSGCIAKAQLTTAPGNRNPEQSLANASRDDKTLTALLLSEDITIDLAYLLRNLTDSELNRYAEFTESAAAQSFYKNLIAAIGKSMTLASDRIQTDQTHSAFDF